MQNSHIIFTIIAKNYLAQALSLRESLKTHSPQTPFFICISDMPRNDLLASLSGSEQSYLLENDDFKSHLICFDEIEHPRLPELFGRYDATEYCTAIKPTVFRQLLKKFPDHCVSYFDPDILVFGPLTELEDHMGNHSVTLIPHLSVPPEDEYWPNILDIQNTGLFNFGYVGFNPKFKATQQMLLWWERRLEFECTIDPERGIFVDQKWGNFFVCQPDAGVFLHPGYNVAYWNLHERLLTYQSGDFRVNDAPLRFFHFSGYDPGRPDSLSKYQTRIVLKAHRPLLLLCTIYGEKLFRNGFKAWKAKSYGLPAGYLKRYLKTPISSQPDNIRKFAQKEYATWKYANQQAVLALGIRSGRGFVFFGIRAAFWLTEHLALGYKSLRVVHAFALKKLVGFVGKNSGFFRRWVHPAAKLPQQDQATFEKDTFSLYGYLTAEMGMGELGRGMARGLDQYLASSKVSLRVIDIDDHLARKEDQEFLSRSIQPSSVSNGSEISIVVVNADQVTPILKSKYGEGILNSKFRIGCWIWETEDFPQKWAHRSAYFDQIWVATQFVASSIAKQIKTPIRVIPPVLPSDLNHPGKFDWAKYKIPANSPIILSVFDASSFVTRKNPHSTLSAFRDLQELARKNGQPSPWLVLKVNNLTDGQKHELEKAAPGLQVIFISEYFSRADIIAMIHSSQCFVSLHRCEGLGLGIIEAMALGVPVVTTAYSGNMDFTKADNSFLVDYALVPALGEVGPYHGSLWAEPDLKSASKQLYEAVFNDHARNEKISLAKRKIAEHFEVSRISILIKESFELLGK